MITKLIINIKDNIDPEEALFRVIQVINQGRISNNGRDYCYATSWDSETVYAQSNKKSDTFTVVKTPK